jgi:hypothetical protein
LLVSWRLNWFFSPVVFFLIAYPEKVSPLPEGLPFWQERLGISSDGGKNMHRPFYNLHLGENGTVVGANKYMNLIWSTSQTSNIPYKVAYLPALKVIFLAVVVYHLCLFRALSLFLCLWLWRICRGQGFCSLT